MTTNKPIGPDEMPEETGELLREVFDLADQVAATVTDEQIEERLAKLLGQAEEPLPQYLSQADWQRFVDQRTEIGQITPTFAFVEAKRSHLPSWVHLQHSYRGLKDYVDEQLDRANEIKANAQAEADKILDDARRQAAQIIEAAERHADAISTPAPVAASIHTLLENASFESAARLALGRRLVMHYEFDGDGYLARQDVLQLYSSGSHAAATPIRTLKHTQTETAQPVWAPVRPEWAAMLFFDNLHGCEAAARAPADTSDGLVVLHSQLTPGVKQRILEAMVARLSEAAALFPTGRDGEPFGLPRIHLIHGTDCPDEDQDEGESCLAHSQRNVPVARDHGCVALLPADPRRLR